MHSLKSPPKQARDSASVRLNKVSKAPPPNSALARMRRGGRMTRWFGLALPLGLYILVVLLAPVDVLDKLPWLRTFVDSTQSYIVSKWAWIDIYRHARATQFPQMAMLASVLRISISMLIGVSAWIHYIIHFKTLDATPVPPAFKGRILRFLIGLPLFGFFLMWESLSADGDWSLREGLTTKSRLGYVFMTGGATFFCGMSLGLLPFLLRTFYVENFKRREK